MNSYPVQIVATIGRDEELMASFLEGAGLQTRTSKNFIETFSEAERDSMGVLLITEEAISGTAVTHLGALLTNQPDWSDLPVLVLTLAGEETAASINRQRSRLPLGQLSLLERPVRPDTLLSSVQAALRARKRQFEIRDSVAQRNAVAAALQRSEERLRIATETAHIGTWELDLDSMELDSSDTCKRNFGRLPEHTLTYLELQDAIHSEDIDSVRAAVEDAVINHQIYRAEYRISWPDGSCHWILASGRVKYSAAGAATTIVGITLDTSERHAAMNALLQAEKLAAVGRLSASIAHEINNPLESVTNLLYLARNAATDPASLRYLELADRELRRVSSITTQTLRFHKQQSAPKEVDAKELFESILSIQQGRLINSSVSVEMQLGSDEPIICFEGDVRQVLNNLIGNAVDAMSLSGGRLLLRSRRGTDWRTGRAGSLLTVADTGSGISPDQLKHIFEAFFTTKGISGTGLGLWVCQEIATRHGGRLLVRSSTRQARSGTVFTVFLPSDIRPVAE